MLAFLQNQYKNLSFVLHEHEQGQEGEEEAKDPSTIIILDESTDDPFHRLYGPDFLNVKPDIELSIDKAHGAGTTNASQGNLNDEFFQEEFPLEFNPFRQGDDYPLHLEASRYFENRDSGRHLSASSKRFSTATLSARTKMPTSTSNNSATKKAALRCSDQQQQVGADALDALMTLMTSQRDHEDVDSSSYTGVAQKTNQHQNSNNNDVSIEWDPKRFQDLFNDASQRTVEEDRHRLDADDSSSPAALLPTPTKEVGSKSMKLPLSPRDTIQPSEIFQETEKSTTPTSPTSVLDGPLGYSGSCHQIQQVEVEQKRNDEYEPIVLDFSQDKNTIVLSSVTRLFVDELDDTSFQQVLQDLEENPKIVKLIVSRATSSPSDKRLRSAIDINMLFQLIKNLPKLKCLHMLNFCSSDMVGFHKILFGHQGLLAFKLRLSNGALDETMLRTLISIPSLLDVNIETKKSFAFPILFQSTSVRTLCISSTGGRNGDFAFTEDHILPHLSAVETNKALRSLYLEPRMSCGAFKFLAQALRLNKALDTLQVSLVGRGVEADNVIDYLALGLERNRNLKTLWNLQYDSFQVSQASKDKLIAAIDKNQTIKECLFIDEDVKFQQRKDQLFKRRRATFLEYYFPQVMVPSVNTDMLCQQAKWTKLSKVLERATTCQPEENPYTGCTGDVVSSLKVMTSSICKGLSAVDDNIQMTASFRSNFNSNSADGDEIVAKQQ